MKNVKTRKTKTRMKKFILTGGLLSTVLFLSGCMRFDQETGAPQGFLSEIVYQYLVMPLGQLLDLLADFVGSYGIAIIVFTLLFRLILVPLTLRQQRTAVESQVKMKSIQPITQEIQAEMKATDDPAEQQALSAELMSVYRENNINLGAQLSGCFPLLLQMPIFVAMFQVLRQSEAIANATFLGINLGETSILLALVTGLIYFIQSRLMISSMPEEQQKTAGATMYITPIMMAFIGFSSPAGIALYWAVSGLFSLVQQLFNNYYYKPRIEAEVKEKMGDVNVKRRRSSKPRKEIKAEESSETTNHKQRNKRRNRNRNAGKQQRNRKK